MNNYKVVKDIMDLSPTTEIEMIEQLAEMKRIYSALESLLPESGPACLVVSSASPGEGKTLLVGGLASFSARLKDQRVIAIDLNWHMPALHRFFGLDQSFDFNDMKAVPSVLEFVQPSGIDHLDILTAPKFEQKDAKGNSPGNLTGINIMKHARKAYDMVVVDTSPILPINRSMMDPVIFSKAADGTLLMVLNYVTPKHQVKQAHMILETSGGRVLGVVVNQWKNPML